MGAIWFLLCVGFGCSQPEKKEIRGVWEGDPRTAGTLSEDLEAGDGSLVRVKIFDRGGELWGYMALEGELSFSVFSLEKGDDTWGETKDIQLGEDEVSAHYSESGLDFRVWGCFEGDVDEVLVLSANREYGMRDDELFFRDLPLQRTDLEEVIDTGDSGI